MIGSHGIRAVVPLLVVCCLAVAVVRADGAFDKEFASDAAALSKVNLSMMNGNGDGSDSGRGPVPYYKGLGGPPKRVALVSFYVWDCGNKKESSYRMYGGNYTYHVKNTRNFNVGSEAVDILATEFYDASIDGMKSAFGANGMELLGPSEFLDTAEKKEAYDTYELKMSGLVKFLGRSQKGGGDTWKSTGTPDGFRVFQLVTINDVKGNHFTLGATGVGVGKLAKSLGYDLARALGVDAVAILYNVVQGEKRAIRMRGSYLYMFGPNPIADTGQSLYWSGHQYSGDYLRMDVPFIETDKDGKAITSDYTGYAVVAKALATKMGEHLKEKTTGAK